MCIAFIESITVEANTFYFISFLSVGKGKSFFRESHYLSRNMKLFL